MALQLDVITPERRLLSEQVDSVNVPGAGGELGILPGHTPLLGQLADPGTVRITTDGGERAYTVNGGFVSVSDEGVSILAETAEPADAQAH